MFGLGLHLENFSLKIQNFAIFSLLGQKAPRSKIGRPLISCGTKVCLGWVGSGPITTLKTDIFYQFKACTLLWVAQLGIKSLGDIMRLTNMMAFFFQSLTRDNLHQRKQSSTSSTLSIGWTTWGCVFAWDP